MTRTVLVTGGAGFIGSNFVRMLVELRPDWRIVNLDKLTYAGNLENLTDIEGHPGYAFVHGDVAVTEDVERAFDAAGESGVSDVVHFAAESHVDRSILGGLPFVTANVVGTQVLLDVARARGVQRFVHVSTDEVYGSLGKTGFFTEETPLAPNSPYSASKAGSDMLVRAAHHTHGFPALITRCSNNYGPFQFPEKVIPLFVTNAIDDIPVPLYGDGKNVRDWLHVLDHCRAVDLLVELGVDGEVYNIGGGNDIPNIDLTHQILDLLGKPRSLIRPVADRPGHDRRYCLDTTKLRGMGWVPRAAFDDGLRETVDWYRRNEWWWRPIKEHDPAFRSYYQAQYERR
jgi:dTDP-glucose 4,6-dehydratase